MASTTGSVAGTVPETPEPASEDPVPSSLTELAALEAARDEKRSLLDRAAEVAAQGLGRSRKLPVGCSPADLPALLQRYYWSEPAAEVIGHDPAELAALALGHLKLGEVRPQGGEGVLGGAHNSLSRVRDAHEAAHWPSGSGAEERLARPASPSSARAPARGRP